VNVSRVIAIAKKEFIHIFRDPRSLGMAIAIPMLLLILFGYALTVDVDNVALVVWNQDKGQESTDYILNFAASKYFNVVAYVDSYDELQRFIDESKTFIMALVIPYNFSRKLNSNQSVELQLLVDGSDSNTATIAIGYATAISAKYNKRLLIQRMAEKGIKYRSPIDLRERVWFNPDLKSKNYIIPGLIAVIMMVIAALLTSLTIAKEWEMGTMEQLIATPIDPRELIAGKLLPYFLIGLFDVAVAVVMGQFLFHVPLRGSVALLFILSGFFFAGALSLGLLISIVAKNQLVASQVAMVTTFLPAFLLSGFMYTISNMPTPIQVLTHFIPARYFVVILKGIYLKGVGLRVLAMQAFYLLLFGFITMRLASKKFKKRVC